jgi:exopolysaccharide biosynthesis protein
VTLEKYNRFTTGGWINSDVLRVDLSNENVKVDGMFNKSSVKSLSTVKSLAESYGAIAAVNANFFDMKTGDPYGVIMSSGKFAVAATGNDVKSATFSMDELNNVLFEHWDTKIELITPKGERKPIAAYNRYTGYYNSNMYIVDSQWGQKTPGVTAQYPDWTEMVVENGVVKEFSVNKPGIEIPKNGYVVMATFGQDKYLADNFKIGDPVNFDITMNADSSKMKMALTGGTLLVQGGKVVTDFTHYPAAPGARAARTAVGTADNGKTLIVAAVDGDSSVSKGMTVAEMADYMYELGCTDAVNFDGGGSTTMVARNAGENALSVLNKPSDGRERRISGSLGIFSLAPKGPVDSLLVTPYENYVFVNTSRAFTAKGLDKYLNPVDINMDDIKWSVAGVQGTFKDNVFYPASAGEATITAKLGDNVIGTCLINVLSAPVKLSMNYDKLNTKPNKSTSLTLKGWDKNGFSASIAPANAVWNVVGKAGTIKANVFTAASSGTGYVSASVAGTSVYCPVSIESQAITKKLDEFNTTATLSTVNVDARYDKVKNVYKSYPYSSRLTYNFEKTSNQERTAYINFLNEGYSLENNTSKLGLWVYSPAKTPVSLGTLVSDKNGKVYSKYFSEGLTWTGWKYLEVSLSDISNPSKVTQIFVTQPNNKKVSGKLYFDDLTAVYSGYPDVAAEKTAVTTVPKDENYSDRSVSGSDSFSFSVFGQSEKYTADKNAEETALLGSLAGRINKSLQASVTVGTADDLGQSVSVPALSTTAGYKSISANGNLLIQLGTATGNSIRMTDSNQWVSFKNELASFAGNNVFVCTAIDPDSFGDKREGALLKDMLAEYKKQNPSKNVWVFYKGLTNSSRMEKGIKYISTAGFDIKDSGDNNKKTAKYITVKCKGNAVTYCFNSIN